MKLKEILKTILVINLFMVISAAAAAQNKVVVVPLLGDASSISTFSMRHSTIAFQKYDSYSSLRIGFLNTYTKFFGSGRVILGLEGLAK